MGSNPIRSADCLAQLTLVNESGMEYVGIALKAV